MARNAIHESTAKAIGRRYETLVELIGDREVIASAIGAANGCLDQAISDLAGDYDFGRHEMEELYGRYFDATC